MVTAVRIDGTDITVTISPTSPDTFTVSLNTLKTGIHDTVRFTLLNGTKQDYVERKLRVIKGGDLNLEFDPLTRNAAGKVVATLKDEHGRPVGGYTVKMEVGNVSETQTTNANGQAISDTPINDTDAAKKTVLCIAENWTKTENGVTIRYLGTQKGLFRWVYGSARTHVHPAADPAADDRHDRFPHDRSSSGDHDRHQGSDRVGGQHGFHDRGYLPDDSRRRDHGECRQPDRGQPFPRFRDSEPVWSFADGFRDKRPDADDTGGIPGAHRRQRRYDAQCAFLERAHIGDADTGGCQRQFRIFEIS